jgi:hypothetical protein
MIESIVAALNHSRFLLHDEKDLQQQMEKRLSDCGIVFSREHRLDARSIPDFYIDGIVVEVKIKGNPKSIYKQCQRYAQFDEVKAILLVTNKSIGWPEEINGKPAYFLNLGRAWL